STEARDALRKLHRDLGYIERQLDDVEEKLVLARRIDALRQRKDELYGEIERTKDRITELRAAQEQRLAAAYKKIEKGVIHFLRNDLRRQDSFENPTSVQFSFKN